MNAKAGIFPVIVSCLFFSYKAYRLGMIMGNESGHSSSSGSRFSAGDMTGNPFSPEPITEAVETSTKTTPNSQFKPRRGGKGMHSNPFVD